MKMPSVMKGGHAFSKVPAVEIQRSTFDRSHGHKTTFDAGYLIPFFVDEALPGDTFNVSSAGFARLTTPLKPVMDNLYMDTFFFAVPYRLVWNNFEKFMGEQTNPGDSTSFVLPVFTSYVPGIGGMSDYMGIPVAPQVTTAIPHVSLWHRAYNLIYNEWFRDQNLINSAVVDVDDGPDVITDYPLRRRGKRHDYFTSCLPWPQKGTAVSLPLGTTAPVVPTVLGTSLPVWRNAANSVTGATMRAAVSASTSAVNINSPVGDWTASEEMVWQDPQLSVNLSGATSATINQLRQAFQVQKLLERDARGGTRYTEKVKAHFGVTSPDARLQRPEYLGGGSSPILFSPVAQNGATPITGGGAGTPATPQGNLAGVATSSFEGHGFAKSFTEHTLLLGLVSVRADLTYQQGLNRMFSRSTIYDLFWPALAHIGEQAVLNKELYITGGANDDLVFGYQERYAEYRYKPSIITGNFRSTGATPFDQWHLSQEFGSLPTLGQTFIEEDPPIARVVAVTTEPQLFADFWFKMICARPMPVFGVPGLIDHF